MCRRTTGAVRWAYQIAPAERFVVAYGQMESAWPCFRAILHEDRIIASAGRHAELDGGIRIVALEPASGRWDWERQYHVASDTAFSTGDPQGDRGLPRARVGDNRLVNPWVAVHDGRLILTSGYYFAEYADAMWTIPR